MTTVAEMVTYQERVDAMKRAGFWSPEEAARFDALRSSEYVLILNDGSAGERWPCKECGLLHRHFTLLCIERPFRGLTHGLYAYWANVGGRRTDDLSPTQIANLDVLKPVFGEQPIPLASSHPSTAAALGTDDRDALLGATVLGMVDPISTPKARLRIEMINAKAGRRVLAI